MSQATVSVQDWLASANAAKSGGRAREAADCLIAAIRRHEATKEPLPRGVYFDLSVLLHQLSSYQEMLRWADAGLARQAKNPDLFNAKATALRRLGRHTDALSCCREATKLDRRAIPPLVNSGRIYLDQKEGARAVEIFVKLVRMQPRSARHHNLLGRAYRVANDFTKAERHFRLAVQLAGADPGPFADLAAFLAETGRPDEALALCEKAEERLGPQREVLDCKLVMLRLHGRRQDAIELLEREIARTPDQAWLYIHLARALHATDPLRANEALRKAIAIEPDNPKYLTELSMSLERTRVGEEAANIAEAYELALRRLALGGDLVDEARRLRAIFIRCANYDAAKALGTSETLGPCWAKAGHETALHHLMGQVETPEDRRALTAFHRLWGKGAEALAASTPIRRAPAVTGRAKIRIGFMSSDLRDHPVSYFVAPLLKGYDRGRFEVYCYSWSSAEPDQVQRSISQTVDAFRLCPYITDRDAAQLIADDQLDVLFELGGSTHMNKIRVMAWRPAPRQASWLGYPHSCGLSTIDRIVTDPFITPPDPALLIEKPLELPHTWVAFDETSFGPVAPIDPLTPQERTGSVTFGTMNNPGKYNPRMIGAWAEILSKTPNSRFLFVRPEGAVAPFRKNIEAHFAANGVDPARIHYTPVRGRHRPHYNAIDVALDTFPQTGGTTTCETLSMGTPVVSLVGEAFFERLSYSNLNNVGLGRHCPSTRERYVDLAVELAGAVEWRREFRMTARDRLKSHPLGRPDWFVRDFQNAVIAWMDSGEAER
jgi:protein O-GlcNAc transferase